MYRPTVRMSEEYRLYVDEIFKQGGIDRNQIIRLALFMSAHSNLFRSKIEGITGKEFPRPKWSMSDDDLWLYQSREGEDVQ